MMVLPHIPKRISSSKISKIEKEITTLTKELQTVSQSGGSTTTQEQETQSIEAQINTLQAQVSALEQKQAQQTQGAVARRLGDVLGGNCEFAHARQRRADLLQITILSLVERDGIRHVVLGRLRARNLRIQFHRNRRAGRIIRRRNEFRSGRQSRERLAQHVAGVFEELGAGLRRDVCIDDHNYLFP